MSSSLRALLQKQVQVKTLTDAATKSTSKVLSLGSRAASPTWLADHDPAAMHPETNQRTIPSSRAVSEKWTDILKVEAVGEDSLKIDLAKDNKEVKSVVYPVKWLMEHAPASTGERSALRGLETRVPWRGTDKFPRLCFKTASTSDILRNLGQFGRVLFENAPPTSEETEAFVRKHLGPPRETLYGGMWDTAPRVDDPSLAMNDTAYTKEALSAHTDACYFADAPGLQVFNCVAQSGTSQDADEGATITVDGLALAHEMAEKEPEAFDFFSNVQLAYEHNEPGLMCRNLAPVFRLETKGDPSTLLQFRYNCYDLAPLDYLANSNVDLFYKFVPKLDKLVESSEFVSKTKLKVGEMVVVDNHRVLHGRTAFKGYRNLIGCYVGMDDWTMRCRAEKTKREGKASI